MTTDEKKLESFWNVWIHKNTNTDWSIKSYKQIYKIKCIETLWTFFNEFINLNKLDYQYFIMRNNILPRWEDNKNCGIFSIKINFFQDKLKNDMGSEIMACLSMLILNETFVLQQKNIIGISYLVKLKNVYIKIWIDNYNNNVNFNETIPIYLLNQFSDILIQYDSCKGNNKKIHIKYEQKTEQSDE